MSKISKKISEHFSLKSKVSSSSSESQQNENVQTIHCQSYYDSISTQSSSELEDVHQQIEALKETIDGKENGGMYMAMDPRYRQV